MAGRGMLTPAVQAAASDLMGREITVRELRLMPYLAYVVQNSRVINQCGIHDEERDVLRAWESEGRVSFVDNHVVVTKQFWDVMNQLVWLAYVNYEQEQPL